MAQPKDLERQGHLDDRPTEESRKRIYAIINAASPGKQRL